MSKEYKRVLINFNFFLPFRFSLFEVGNGKVRVNKLPIIMFSVNLCVLFHLGFSGDKITDVVNIGIGGSDLVSQHNKHEWSFVCLSDSNHAHYCRVPTW